LLHASDQTATLVEKAQLIAAKKKTGFSQALTCLWGVIITEDSLDRCTVSF
jgi:hypothetical protein